MYLGSSERRPVGERRRGDHTRRIEPGISFLAFYCFISSVFFTFYVSNHLSQAMSVKTRMLIRRHYRQNCHEAYKLLSDYSRWLQTHTPQSPFNFPIINYDIEKYYANSLGPLTYLERMLSFYSDSLVTAAILPKLTLFGF